MTNSTLKEFFEQLMKQGTYNGSFYELYIPQFITADNKIVQCVSSSCKWENLDDPISLRDCPIVVFFANPGEKEATHRAYEKDFVVNDFNKIVTLVLNADKHKKLKQSAEDKLKEILEKFEVKDWKYSDKAIYYGVSENDICICARYDKEDSPDSSSGIRLEIFPPYDSLRHDEGFIKHMKDDIMEGGVNYLRLGKFIDWLENGTKESRPEPMDMYYSDAADSTSGMEILYIDDEYEDIEPKEKQPIVLANTKPYFDMVRLIKENVLELIESAVLENGAQVDKNLEIAYADTECCLERNHTDNTLGVIIQPNQDKEKQLELCFVHGTKFESPDYSTDVPLRDLPVESLILIYNNLK